MKVLKLIVNTKSERYPILIGSNLLPNISKIFRQYKITFQKCLLIIDKNIPAKNISVIKKNLINKNIFLYKFNATEKNKNQKSIDKIVEILLKKNFSRQDCIISVGGGITGDISGYAASLFKRGIQFVNVPSTLLAQVDSSIGGKTESILFMVKILLEVFINQS